MKQLFITSRKNIYSSIIVLIIVIFLSQLDPIIAAFRAETLQPFGFHANLISEALISDYMTLTLPIIAALPYTSSFIDDVKSGFIKEYLPRTTLKEYIIKKICICAISGGMVLVIGILLSYGISFLVFSPMEMALEEGAVAEPYFANILKRALLFLFSGAFWSLVGMTFSTITNSRYMAYASPFIFYYVLIILNERYFNSAYIIYPKEWVNPSDFWMFGNFGAIIWLVELIILISIVFYYAAKRRIMRI